MQIGLGISLSSMQRRRDTPASVIASIFSDSEGFTTPLTLDQYFSDTAGEEVSENTDPIALALDPSQGLTLGPELFSGFPRSIGTWVDNGDGSWSIDGTQESDQDLDGDGSIDAQTGDTLEWSFVISGLGSGQTIRLFANSSSPRVFTNGTHKILRQRNSALVRFRADAGVTATISNISVRKLPGNHLRQTSSTFRPTLSAGDILFDGGDDRLVSPYVSGTSGSLFARFNGATASRVLLGAQPATDGRAFLALDASGRIGAGIGEQSTGVIFAGPDLRNSWHSGGVTWDGTTVKLYLDGAEVYSEPQVGAVSGTTPAVLGALNANGTAAAFWDGRISNALAVDRALTPDEITKLTNKWSA